MIKSFATVYKEFNRTQLKRRKEYETIGMTKQQIQKIEDFDKQQFARDIAYMRRTKSLSENVGDFELESQNPLLYSFLEQLSCEMDLLQTSRYWWLEEIEDERLNKKLRKLSDDDLELLTLLIFDGFSQAEVAQQRKCSQRAISKKYIKLKLFLENGSKK
ncbi:MAG: hypothetical protein EOM05_07165 [Clostridia bacterium]|nr:hypothetical protein [Clostridia bacterium]